MVLTEELGDIMTQEEFLDEFALDKEIDNEQTWTEAANDSFNQKYAS